MSKVTRELCLEQFVDEIYEDSQRNEDSKYVFFLGAGCSRSSEIPLAWELAQRWYKELKKQSVKFQKFIESEGVKEHIQINEDDIQYAEIYFKVFEALFPTPLAQQKEIQSLTEGKIPALGYYVLASLMQKTSFNTVVTTNFDNLIHDSIIYSSGKRALVITHQDLARFIERNSTPLIVKVHGDAHMHPHNNENGTLDIPSELKSAIQGLFINAKVVCIGYGGNDKSIAKLLEGCGRIDQVYWLNKNEPKDVEIQAWWNALNNKTFIPERDFDKIMHAIKRKFTLDEPNFNKLVSRLEFSYTEYENKELENNEIKEVKTYNDYISMADIYDSQKETAQAISFYKKALKLENKFYPNAKLGFIYQQLNDEKNTEKYYKKALELEPNHAIINGNYANFLSNIKKDYEQAEIHYKKALELEPNDAIINGNYANFLSNIKKDYEQAEIHYKKALEVEPNHADFNGNYASFLSDIKKDYEQAEIHYKKALELEPNHANINGNYASFLFAQGRLKEATLYLGNAYKYNENKNLEIELEFYRLAHLKDSYEDAKKKLDALLGEGYESKDWSFSQNIKRAIEDKHKHVDVLKEYARKISGLSYDDI